MPSEESCSRLIATSLTTDLIDIVTSFLPIADEVVRNITDQVQLNTEIETLGGEFNEYRRYYSLPATLRAMLVCQIKTGKVIIPRPQLPRLEMR